MRPVQEAQHYIPRKEVKDFVPPEATHYIHSGTLIAIGGLEAHLQYPAKLYLRETPKKRKNDPSFYVALEHGTAFYRKHFNFAKGAELRVFGGAESIKTRKK